MSKRKRENDFAVNQKRPVKRASNTQGIRLESVLERSKQTLCQALKLAKGFERQKLGRRQKTAKAAQDDGESKRLAAEVAALKSLDVYSLAELYLYKSMIKTTSIISSPNFPSWIETKLNKLSKPQDSAHTNVQARLFNSQPVKKAMNDSMDSIRACFGLDERRDGKKKRLRKEDYQRVQGSNGEDLSRTRQDAHRHTEDTGLESFAADEAGPGDSDQADGSGEELDFENYDSRLAGSSDDSFEGFSEAAGSEDLHTYSKKDTSRSSSPSPSPSPSESAIPPDLESHGSPRALKTSTVNPKGTTFLPSLMMGGYWSGSEPGSDEEGVAEETRRKNRRGQQERRLIAEKKFGQNANHVKKQKKESDRDRGWDARRGAQASGGRENQRRGNGRTNRVPQASRFTKGAASSSGANSDPVGPRRIAERKQAADLPLHPSWQAAKTAKEQKKTATFQGKKVVFD